VADADADGVGVGDEHGVAVAVGVVVGDGVTSGVEVGVGVGEGHVDGDAVGAAARCHSSSPASHWCGSGVRNSKYSTAPDFSLTQANTYWPDD
jgi:hypothetical protein